MRKLLTTSVRRAVAVAQALVLFGFTGMAAASTGNSIECARPDSGGRLAIECRVTLDGVRSGTALAYAFVRKGCYHPGSTRLNGSVAIVRRSDIGNGSWVLHVRPKLGNRPAVRLAFRIAKRQ